jgi:hypothetical protein
MVEIDVHFNNVPDIDLYVQLYVTIKVVSPRKLTQTDSDTGL